MSPRQWLSILAFAFGLAGPAARAEAPAPALTIEARLFVHSTGQFSENVLAPDARPLGNIVIGHEPSSATLVIVRVADWRQWPGPARVRLIATERPLRHQRPGRRTLLDQSLPLPYSGEAPGQPAFVGFWLSGTGCVPIRLRATLAAAGAAHSAREALLDFRCYE